MKKLITFLLPLVALVFIFSKYANDGQMQDRFIKRVDEKKLSKPLAYTTTEVQKLEKIIISPNLNKKPQSFSAQSISKFRKRSKLEEKVEESFKYDFDRIKNPITGTVPENMMIDGLEATKRLQQVHFNNREDALKWTERGPNNVGGRTRVILVDENDSTRRTVFAGSVSGGLWKTTDITAAKPIWVKINDQLENLSIGALVQDPRDPKIMYMGTGEGYPNADAVRGVGIFKSTDGGNTWNLLPSTKKANNFAFIQRLVFNPITNALFAATGTGLFKTNDGGLTWSKSIISSKVFDLEWSPAGYMLASSGTSIFKLSNADTTTFVNLTSNSSSGFLKSLSRVEFNVCRDYPNVIYAIGSANGAASNVARSNDYGVTWNIMSPASPSGGDITNGQAWYDLTICVAPYDSNRVWVGGVPMSRSTNGGLTFSSIANNLHSDQHITMFDPKMDSVMYAGNDGGIYRSINAKLNNMTFEAKEDNYITTQFYACAMHPDSLSNYFLGGTQDNNSLKLNGKGISGATVVKGGDGMFCHIDQKDPKYQMACSQNAVYNYSTNGGQTWSFGYDFKGNWAAASDYDNFNGVMYTQSSLGDIFEWKVRSGLPPRRMTIKGTKLAITALLCDPNKGGRVYIGSSSGYITVIEDALTGDTNLTAISLTKLPLAGNVTCISVEEGNENHMIVSMSNLGLENSIFESFDRGKTWRGVEGIAVSADKKFPDISVRWVIFAPGDATKAIIATEFGVWNTQKLDGDNTVWIPPSPINGTPLVRTEMLQYRKSDNLVLAGTYGRGLWTTEAFSPTIPKMAYEKVTYLNTPVSFQNLSLNYQSVVWDFGDGTTSTEDNPTHTYTKVGTYTVSIKLNNISTINSLIYVLPDLSLPYQSGFANYGGDFEGFTEQYAVDTKSGTSFERGNSTEPNKSGVKSGSNAFVTGLKETYYQPYSDTRLYLSNFNMKDAGIYEFSFWAKQRLQEGTDGYLIEYSLDKGLSWNTLGTAKAGWYTQTSPGTTFPTGTPFFSTNTTSYTRFALNISDLAGNENVAFRIVFKSDDTGSHAGVALDNVEITKFSGELQTKVIDQSLAFNTSTELQINWNTLPEYYCSNFEIELSTNGIDFKTIKKVNATGILTANKQSYSIKEVATSCIYFVRIKVINENKSLGYSKTFYTPIMSIKRDNECGTGIFEAFPNPFNSFINLSFTEVFSKQLKIELFDNAGKKIRTETVALKDATYYTIKGLEDLPNGVYLLRTQFDNEASSTYKLLKSN